MKKKKPARFKEIVLEECDSAKRGKKLRAMTEASVDFRDFRMRLNAMRNRLLHLPPPSTAKRKNLITALGAMLNLTQCNQTMIEEV